ncbi:MULTISPECIES: glucoamylase family protein [unclassified Luteococcus]|uniref:glucoamylase family protein n=1 Tax=unclassified Luteococcus TaxID=2639923 RepID=UPI00313CBF7C
MQVSRRSILGGLAGAAVASTLPTTANAQAADPAWKKFPPGQRKTLVRWATDTWRSLDAMSHPVTGLVADNIDGDLTSRSGFTSPTNIGGLLWSAMVARDLGVITEADASARIARTLTSLKTMERHEPSGMYYNWYDEATGALLHTWPENGNHIDPFISSVDMGWLGAALWLVANGDPANRKAALDLFEPMRWDVFFDREYAKQPGATYGGFYTSKPNRDDVVAKEPINGVGGDPIWYTATHHYDTAISEARMVTYLGIMRGQIPAAAYFATWRTFPADWTWPEMPTVGANQTYLGVDVYEGAHTYRGMHIVPGWGGSMFEELMPDLFVPEAEWGPRSWGINHPLHVRAQREHGLLEAKYGYWGFSPCSNPAGGYREYGVDALGLNPEGYFSDQEKTDYRWDNPPKSYGDGVVTPHAGFLGMMYEHKEGFRNLQRIESELKCYGKGGFYDAATRSGEVARRYLSLDQAMVMGALGNILLDGGMRKWFATREVAQTLRPVIGMETFGAGIVR